MCRKIRLTTLSTFDNLLLNGDNLQLRVQMTNTGRKSWALIVEDETLISMIAAEALQELGFETVEVGSAKAALDELRRNTFDVALVDIGLPDRQGDELVVEVRALSYDLPIIIATGYTGKAIYDRFRHDRRIVILNKPYDSAQIRTVIDALAVL
ncbi:MAG TPA: response regulator [Xanthobacteraceae bacterium]|nr:response regulator [Xanthobacteraceae bacterium]